MSSSQIHNIAHHLIHRASIHPHGLAVSCALGSNRQGRRLYTHLTFEQLNRESARVALGMHQKGFKPGMKALVMVKPGPDLFVLTFALFKAGIAPVLIDPGMQKSSLKQCIAQAEPQIFIGIPLAHWARRILGWGKKSVQYLVSTQKIWGVDTCLADLKEAGAQAKDDYIYDGHAEDLAAVLFTSGSTGTPKGAQYRHGHFVAQVDLLQKTYQFTVGDIDIPTFPLFALFDPALGMSAVFPQMDFSAPLKANPQEIFAVMNDFGARNLFCSPALLKKLSHAVEEETSQYADQGRQALSTLKRVISAGAPVSPHAMRTLKRYMHEEGEIYTPYGATESLPICSISCTEIWQTGMIGQQQGHGVCVGRLVEGVHITTIPITHTPFHDWGEIKQAKQKATRTQFPLINGYQVGEIVVYAPSTTQKYLNHVVGDTGSKILGAPPQVVVLPGQSHSHRMGDVGYMDDQGYVWLCGRKSHCVITADEHIYLPLCVEGIFNQTAGVKRCALAQFEQQPVLCVEVADASNTDWMSIVQALQEQGQKFAMTQSIQHFIPHPSFPVDTRHNAKIKREKLSQWLKKVHKKITHTKTLLT